LDRATLTALIEQHREAIPTAWDELRFGTSNPKLEGREAGFAAKLYDYFNAFCPPPLSDIGDHANARPGRTLGGMAF
jgi:hypothetical protein